MRPLVATYRLQLGPRLTFADVVALVPYLRDLGVSHLYLSPIMQARHGSVHGYDVVDPRRVSDVLGGEEGLRSLASMGLDLIVDIVPNHMAVSAENPFWDDPKLRAQFFDLDGHGAHRRFFDIDDLAGVRVEDRDVFEVTHGTIIDLVRDGVVAGVRVDHIDGLADPAAYLAQLRAAGVEHVWVEKILVPGEHLPPWPVEGTTGYDFLVDADALFVDPTGLRSVDTAVGSRPPFVALAAAAKAEQVSTTFRAEVAWLRRIADVDHLEAALTSLPVYRTYLDPVTRDASGADAAALAHLPDDFVAALGRPETTPAEFVVRFQQTTGAVMAKGVEDTAMYRDVRLLTLDEVGGDPDRFGITVADFHSGNTARAEAWPRSLLAATTHDTKRSADVRARIAVLSTIGEAWLKLVAWWRDLCAEHSAAGRGPDADEQLFILQTLIGVWPVTRERLDGYLVKAMREAKRHTSWVDPDEAWEQDVLGVVDRAVRSSRFRELFDPLLGRLVPAAERIALGALVLRCTAPGVPDVYQGDELWNHLLVDPDNRRPVDWAVRRELLDRLRRGGPVERSTAKLFVTDALLALRARIPGFVESRYLALRAPDDVCAFARGTPDAVVVVPVRPTQSMCVIDELDIGAGDGWVDVLAPLEAVYGTQRSAVFVRAPFAESAAMHETAAPLGTTGA